MDKVFVFEWCDSDSVYGSAFTIISIHKTKLGAFKTMVNMVNERWRINRDAQLMYCVTGKIRDDPLQYESWRIRTIKVQN